MATAAKPKYPRPAWDAEVVECSTQAQMEKALKAAKVAMLRQLRVRADMERAGYDLKAYVRALPVMEQLDLVDFLAHQLSWSYGADQIGRGADFIRDELAEEAEANARRGNGLS